MECPDCGYAMTPFDKECPRCRNTRSRNEGRVNSYVAHQERLTHETQAAKSFQPPADVTDPVEPQTGWQVGLPPPADASPRAVHDYVEPDAPAPDAHDSRAVSGSPRVAPIPPLMFGVPDTAKPVFTRTPPAVVWATLLLILGIMTCFIGFGWLAGSHASRDRVDADILLRQETGRDLSQKEADTVRSAAMTEDQGTQQITVITLIIGGAMCLPFFVVRKRRANGSKG